MTTVTLYTKPDCSLCDDAREAIERARAGSGFRLEEVDIEQDAALWRRYRERIPVVHVDGRPAFELTVDEQELRRLLGEAAEIAT